MRHSIDELELSAVAEADLPAVCQFVTLVFNRDARLVQSWFDHWWTLNPVWNESIPRGWILRAQNNDIIAFTSNIPLPYVIGGKRGTCYATGTTGVHPNWRGKGLAKIVGRAFVEQKTPDLLVGAGSTPEAFKLWQSLGMVSLSLEWPDIRLLVASYQKMTKEAVKRRGIPDIVADSLGLFGLLWDKRATRVSSSETVERVTQFEPSDDESIVQCRASDAFTYPLRNVSIINWLYFGTPYLRKSRLVFAARSCGRLLGFAAFKIIGTSLYLLECRCLGADPGIASDLIAFSRVGWRELGGTHLTIWPYAPMIEAAVPRAKTHDKQPMTYVYRANRAAISEREWEITPGDGDIALF
jgi:hypothetical protein